MGRPPVVLAIAAHPDDIEFMMAGTLIRLRETGWALHYLNLANGSCGTATESARDIAATRLAEAKAACDTIGATHHPPFCDDLDIVYSLDLVAKTTAVVRAVAPTIVLTQSPEDYMEDHVNASRIAAAAAFCRGMRNARCLPPAAPCAQSVTVYHALPYGLRGPLRQRLRAGQYVDVSPCLPEKRAMLACHRSQKEWLDQSQGLDAYLDTMESFAREVGTLSGPFPCAEGWRRRLHLGFCGPDDDPLGDALESACVADAVYEDQLNQPR